VCWFDTSMNFLRALHRLLEFVGELRVLLVRPGVAERAETGLQRSHAVLEVAVEFFQLLGEAPGTSSGSMIAWAIISLSV